MVAILSDSSQVSQMPEASPHTTAPDTKFQTQSSSSHTAVLLMICRVLATASDGSSVEARALLDNATSFLFVSEWPLFARQNIHVSGIGSLLYDTLIQSISNFKISAIKLSGKKIDITAVVVPKLTP